MDKNRRPELGASQGYGIGRTRQRYINWRNDHGFVIGGYAKNGTDQVNLQSIISPAPTPKPYNVCMAKHL